MPCKVTFTLLQESLTGDVGNDWHYTVRADMVDPMVFGSGTIEVPEHLLRPGVTQRPPNADHAVELDGGDHCGGEIRVRFTLEATEVDFLVDDHGSNVSVASVQVPAEGGEPITTEHEIAARVKEAPGFQGGVAVLRVKVRLVGRCG
jgi:hypothetical protein